MPEQRPSVDGTRHPGVVAILAHFEYDHLPAPLRPISQMCHDLAHEMVRRIPDDPQLTTGLHDLLRAKDAFVRAARVALDREEAVTDD